MKFARFWPNLLVIIAIGSCVAVLMAHAYTGSLMRYLADDYCTAAVFNNHGLLEAQKYWYYNWSGRFSFYFLIDLIEIGGIELVPFLPSITIIVWLIGLTWTVSQLLPSVIILRRQLVAIFLAGLILFATLEGTPDVVQSLYWRTGMLTYVAPLLCLTWLVGVVGYQQKQNFQGTRWLWLLLYFGLNFVAGGFSETYVAMQTTTLLLVMVLVYTHIILVKNKGLILAFLWAGLVGSLAALAVVVAAPGNQIRQSHFSPPTNWLTIIWLAAGGMNYFLEKLINSSTVIILFSLLLPFFLALLVTDLPVDYKQMIRLLLGFVLIGFIILLSCFVPAVYGMGHLPPLRALIIPHFVLICLLVGLGYASGILIKQLAIIKNLSSNALFALIYIPLVLWLLWNSAVVIQSRLKTAAQARVITTMWDQRDAHIRQAKSEGLTELVVPVLPYSAGLEDIGPNPDHWVNACVADYYGLDSIKAQ